MNTLAHIADINIAAPFNKCTIRKKNGVTEDIIAEIIATDKKSRNDTKKFANYLKGGSHIETLLNDWNFVKENIRYQVDPLGDQYVKTPARTWSDKFADCKSYSIFLASLLKNQGIDFAYRFTSYSEQPIFTHVYIVAFLNGSEIILDDVMPDFNSEKPYNFKKDITMTKIYNLSGIGLAEQPGMVKKEFNLGNRDISEMSEGEMDLWIARDRLLTEKKIVEGMRGIGTLKAEKYQDSVDMIEDAIEAVQRATVNGIGALTHPDLEEELATIALHAVTGVYSIANEIHGIGATKKKEARQKRKADRKAIRTEFKGKDRAQKMAEWRKANGTKTGKFLQKVAVKVKKGLKAIGKVLSAPMRLITKGILETTLPKSAPAFLYLFVTDPAIIAKLPEAARAKRKKQEKIAKFIVDGAGMKSAHLMGILRNGIMKQMGDTPENIIAKQMAGKLSGIGLVEEAGKLVGGFLTKIIDWIVKLFKGKKGKAKEAAEAEALKKETEQDGGTATVPDTANPEEQSPEVAAMVDQVKADVEAGQGTELGIEETQSESDATYNSNMESGGKSIWNSLK
ncbi:MAG: transglutaminase-like domain-containing protein [Bacteroidota bacterium]